MRWYSISKAELMFALRLGDRGMVVDAADDTGPLGAMMSTSTERRLVALWESPMEISPSQQYNFLKI